MALTEMNDLTARALKLLGDAPPEVRSLIKYDPTNYGPPDDLAELLLQIATDTFHNLYNVGYLRVDAAIEGILLMARVAADELARSGQAEASDAGEASPADVDG